MKVDVEDVCMVVDCCMIFGAMGMYENVSVLRGIWLYNIGVKGSVGKSNCVEEKCVV